MLDRKGWLLYVVGPLIVVLLIDQMTKFLAGRLAVPIELGLVRITLARNQGFMLGSMADLSKLYTVVAPATLGSLLLFVCIVLQDFLPIASPLLRTGTSVFVGGVLGNITDRVVHGEVVDFLQLTTPFGATGVFNVADAVQWVGVAAFFTGYLANGRLLYPVDQRRGRKWIDPTFQVKYCSVLLTVGIGFALTGGVLSYTFLRFAIGELTRLDQQHLRRLVADFLFVYGMTAAAFFVLLAVVGVHLSHRIVGPIRGFENFLDEMLKGSTRRFQLRRTDELRQLETMANRFYALFHERLGLTAPKLEVDAPAPYFEATTADQKRISVRDFDGQKIWIIFYRYATCPLCALHIEDIGETVRAVQAAGVQVLAVFESTVDEFAIAGFETTTSLLKSLNVPLLADPERHLYRAYRTRRNAWTLLRPAVWQAFLRARSRGFLQREIRGKLGQMPAHFLINERGGVAHAFYGRTVIEHLDLETVRRFAGLGPVRSTDPAPDVG